MLDFIWINKIKKNGETYVSPDFLVKSKIQDLMTRGSSFYAVWDEQSGFWSTNERDVQRLVDSEVLSLSTRLEAIPLLLQNFGSNKWSEWRKYLRSSPDNYHELDKKLIFSNEDAKKEDYVTKKLPYPLLEQETPAYEELMSTIYEPLEREKLEWAVGSIIAGESRYIQKFIVLYGAPGSGKSTFLNLIQDMFPGCYCLFNAKNLTGNKEFSLESMKSNPLFAIQHDGDLSRIEDNTILNSIVSHEEMEVNEKFKSKYTMRFESFLFMGTNKPVRITDSKSGIIRRLIDVNPSGKLIPKKRFDHLLKAMKFEYSGIAWRCLQIYKRLGKDYYNSYTPLTMIGETNDIYNFIEDTYDLFKDVDEKTGITLSTIWTRYKEYCEDAKIPFPLTMRLFKVEMKEYFKEFRERDGNRYSVYFGFKKEKFEYVRKEELETNDQNDTWLEFLEQSSLLDEMCKDCKAQYATDKETPYKKWEEVTSKLCEIDTTQLHYMMPNSNHIVADFDLKNESGEKDLTRNIEAASKWPRTYAELSKSGKGIHLHYIYEGDTGELSNIYEEGIEIKVFRGNSSLRRKLTRCNNLPVATISSGLPKKRGKKMLAEETVKSERGLRALIIRNLRKEIHADTRSSIDFIYKILEDAYQNGVTYDLRDMRQDIQQFAMNSTNQASYCVNLVSKMKFMSEDQEFVDEIADHAVPIIFFDVEVFPNLFVLCYTKQKSGNIIRLINPKPDEVEALTKYRLVGFNNRKYDNHIIYARMMGYTNEQLYSLSKRIIDDGDRDAFFGAAYNLSYTDIYDYLSPANKMSLKKWEIKLGIHHQENSIPWDQPVPEERWGEIADYCCNDVFATECVWDATQEDWLAREILSEWSGLTVNDTTNNHTTRIIVGKDPHPQNKFVYTDLSTIFPGYEFNQFGIEKERYNPGTKIVQGKSIYMGEDPSEGGYAFATPGMYTNVALLDIISMHPHTMITLNIFGDEYTINFKNIVDARVSIKEGDLEGAKKYLPEKLHHYLNDPTKAAGLALALKGAINPVYGLTSASFPNKLRDPRNKDNIGAKYGALFMITLKHEVQKLGYTVVHIKTDSIKIANADEKIIGFCMEFARKYHFEFDHEATYEKMCIVNDSVYIAKYKKPKIDKKTGKEIWWTATGTQFQVPYVFKTLFSREPIEFRDICETKSVSTALYLDMNENLPEGEHNYRFIGKIGLFCPIKPGFGGGYLLRQKEDTFSAANGTKMKNGKGVYRWMESEQVEILGLQNEIDLRYYEDLINEAVEEISKYGDFEWFRSDDPVEEITWSVESDLKDGKDSYEFKDAMNLPETA